MNLQRFAGKTVDLDSRDIQPVNGFMVGAADPGIVMHFFLADEFDVSYVARIGLPNENLARFVKMLDTLARTKGIEWQDVDIEEAPDFPAPH